MKGAVPSFFADSGEMINFILVLLSNILFSVVSLVLTLAYAHLGSYEESADLGVALAVCAPLQLFFSMQHGVSILAGKISGQDALSMRVLLLIPFLVLSAIISWVMREPLVFVFSLFRVGDFLYEPLFYELIKGAKGRRLFVEGVIRVFFLVLGGGVCLFYGLGIVETVFWLAVVNGVFVLLKFRGNWRGGALKSLAIGRSSHFLGGSALLASMCVNVPRYSLPSSEPGDLAAYSNMLTLVMGGTLLFGVVNNVIFARSSKLGFEGVVGFLRKSLFFSALGVIFSLVFVGFDGYFSRLFVMIFFGDGYSGYSSLVFGFSVFYFILYLQNSLNCAYIYAGLERCFAIGTAILLGGLFVAAQLVVHAGGGVDVIWFVNLLNMAFCLVMFFVFKSKVRCFE